jgi:pyruvate/2-oxoglutarate dehydrogenase complex dihydrolipoamide dehydrogenase (E3) component
MDFDTVIVGAGQAAVPLAERLAGQGQQVALVERARLGGTCVNTGCTPTKTLYASARAAHVARTAGRLGVAAEVRVDFAAVMARKDRVVARWREGLDRRLAALGDRLRIVRGHARLAGDGEVLVDGERHRARAIVLDVGARPAVPPIQGLEAVPWLDNRRVMELPELPEHLVVVGGGYVGCEFAQMFRRFGAHVTVIEPGPHLLAREDDDVSGELEAAFRREGVEVSLGARPARVEAAGAGIRVVLDGGSAIEGTHLLIATGRRPNTDDLGCDAAGVALDARGAIVADEHFRTTAEGIYAVGDAIGGPQFTHTAWDDHRLLLEVLAGRPGRPRSSRLVPYAVFTDPQVGGVGLTEKAARAAGVAYEVATMPFGHVARAIEMDETSGILKVLVDPATERILGAAIVGAEAGELVQVFAALMQAGAPARHLVEVQAIHPTLVEGLQSVLLKLDRYRA